MDPFGVAVQVGVGPARVCGGGMTEAVGVGGRGVGVAGVGVLGGPVGAEVGGDVVGAEISGVSVVAAAEGGDVTTATGLVVASSVEASFEKPPVAPQPIARRATVRSPARNVWPATETTMRERGLSAKGAGASQPSVRGSC